VTLEQALSIAYAQLNRRERTVHEMRRHLVHRGAEPEVAESALLELIEQGYLDDARFARLFVQDKRELNQWGSARIRRALVERGVSSDLAGAAVSEADAELGEPHGQHEASGEPHGHHEATGEPHAHHNGAPHAHHNGEPHPELGETDSPLTKSPGAGGELERALAVLERRFPGSLAERREWDRALGVLLRKGYEYELALEALTVHRRHTSVHSS
jgi:SOS response regulatory protein OraA/RecX